MRYTVAQKNFLRSRQPCIKCDLYVVSLVDGVTSFYWTTLNENVTVGGHTYVPFKIDRSGLTGRNTTEIPELTLNIYTSTSDLVLSKPFKDQVIRGILDGAVVTMYRLFMPTRGDVSLGTILMFQGLMSSARVNSQVSQISVKGGNVRLGNYGPRNVYQTPCPHRFCDSLCTLNAATFTNTQNAASAGLSRTFIPWTSPPGIPSLYSLGELTMNNGPASGQTRFVKVADSTGLTLQYPLDDTPIVGNSFSVLQGCDKTMSRCSDLGNLQHHRGFPFIPPEETGI